MKFEFHQPIFKQVTYSGVTSLWQKLYQILIKFGFFMINSTKRGQYSSFWWQIWPNHQKQEVLWVNRVVEVAEASEAAWVFKAAKSLLRTSKLSKFLNSALFWSLEQNIFLVELWKIMVNFSTYSVRGCWGQNMSFL